MQDSFDFLAFYSPLLQVQVMDCSLCKWWVLVPASCRPVTSRGRWGRPSCSEDCPVKVPDLLLGLSVLASEILNSQAATFREGKEPAKMGTRDDEYDYLFKGETNILRSHDLQVMCLHLSPTPVVQLAVWFLKNGNQFSSIVKAIWVINWDKYSVYNSNHWP